MSELKLGRLPDRTPVKIIIAVNPDLNQALREYATVYRTEYGKAESVADLIPFMLGAFLQSDKAFAKTRKKLPPEALVEKAENRRQRSPSRSSSTPSKE
jgi:hypothetical protein